MALSHGFYSSYHLLQLDGRNSNNSSQSHSFLDLEALKFGPSLNMADSGSFYFFAIPAKRHQGTTYCAKFNLCLTDLIFIKTAMVLGTTVVMGFQGPCVVFVNV